MLFTKKLFAFIFILLLVFIIVGPSKLKKERVRTVQNERVARMIIQLGKISDFPVPCRLSGESDEWRALVDRISWEGVDALPQLFEQIEDDSPTGIRFCPCFSQQPSYLFIQWICFANEYDAKAVIEEDNPKENQVPEASFERCYTVRLGDLCYYLIGEIVNRKLYPVRYQPSAGLIVSSPLSNPEILHALTCDWKGLTKEGHVKSLIADLGDLSRAAGAKIRLKKFYPEEARKLKI